MQTRGTFPQLNIPTKGGRMGCGSKGKASGKGSKKR